MKEVLVKVTDKSDDMSSSTGNGKVCRKLFSTMSAKKHFQKKNEGRERSNSATPHNDIFDKRIAIREAIRAHWKCETHTTGARTVPCWRDGVTTQCFAITENDLNFWAELHVRVLGILLYQII
jgi:hypothetical protein